MTGKARRGLDALLAHFPDAGLVRVLNQGQQSRLRGYTTAVVGPWTCVDLVVENRLVSYAIWNYTGNVYRADSDGAVEDDPFITMDESDTKSATVSCDAVLVVSIDGQPGRFVRCSLEAGHQDAHAHVVGDVEHFVWADRDYSGPRAARLIRQLLDEGLS